jgi:hypothetical protein
VVDVVLLTEGGVTTRRAGLLDRLRARWSGASLDRRLAAGEVPESALPLALRARWLDTPAQRSALVAGLRRLAAGALPRASPALRDRAGREAALLSGIADRLAAREPAGVATLARVRVLLTDGTGPLYHPAGPDDLHERLLDIP